jgi:hypothetical protein
MAGWPLGLDHPLVAVTHSTATVSVLIVEDATGEGHSTAITSDEDCVIFGVGLPAAGVAGPVLRTPPTARSG